MADNDPYAELEIPAFLKRKKGEKPEPYDEETLAWLKKMRAQGKETVRMKKDDDDPIKPLSNIPSRSAKGHTDARFPQINDLSEPPKKKAKVRAEHVPTDTFKVTLPKKEERRTTPADEQPESQPRKEKPMAKKKKREAGAPSRTQMLREYFKKHGAEKTREYGVKSEAKGGLGLNPATVRVRIVEFSRDAKPKKKSSAKAKPTTKSKSKTKKSSTKAKVGNHQAALEI